jgi:hypothetical protein
MKFVYKPEGVEPRKWDWDPDKLMSPEAEAIERHTKMTYKEWFDAIGRGSMLALHGLLYVMLKRSNPKLQWDEVQFSAGEVTFEMSDEEAAEALASLEARTDLTPEEEAVRDDLRQRDIPAEVQSPKEPAPVSSGDSDTSSPSLTS